MRESSLARYGQSAVGELDKYLIHDVYELEEVFVKNSDHNV